MPNGQEGKQLIDHVGLQVLWDKRDSIRTLCEDKGLMVEAREVMKAIDRTHEKLKRESAPMVPEAFRKGFQDA